ncbi:MAG: hypothetical protein ACI9AR_000342 [Flavobacteriaceae bacterium]|jgi:hypothetical protein
MRNFTLSLFILLSLLVPSASFARHDAAPGSNGGWVDGASIIDFSVEQDEYTQTVTASGVFAPHFIDYYMSLKNLRIERTYMHIEVFDSSDTSEKIWDVYFRPTDPNIVDQNGKFTLPIERVLPAGPELLFGISVLHGEAVHRREPLLGMSDLDKFVTTTYSSFLRPTLTLEYREPPYNPTVTYTPTEKDTVAVSLNVDSVDGTNIQLTTQTIDEKKFSTVPYGTDKDGYNSYGVQLEILDSIVLKSVLEIVYTSYPEIPLDFIVSKRADFGLPNNNDLVTLDIPTEGPYAGLTWYAQAVNKLTGIRRSNPIVVVFGESAAGTGARVSDKSYLTMVPVVDKEGFVVMFHKQIGGETNFDHGNGAYVDQVIELDLFNSNTSTVSTDALEEGVTYIAKVVQYDKSTGVPHQRSEPQIFTTSTSSGDEIPSGSTPENDVTDVVNTFIDASSSDVLASIVDNSGIDDREELYLSLHRQVGTESDFQHNNPADVLVYSHLKSLDVNDSSNSSIKGLVSDKTYLVKVVEKAGTTYIARSETIQFTTLASSSGGSPSGSTPENDVIDVVNTFTNTSSADILVSITNNTGIDDRAELYLSLHRQVNNEVDFSHNTASEVLVYNPLKSLDTSDSTDVSIKGLVSDKTYLVKVVEKAGSSYIARSETILFTTKASTSISSISLTYGQMQFTASGDIDENSHEIIGLVNDTTILKDDVRIIYSSNSDVPWPNTTISGIASTVFKQNSDTEFTALVQLTPGNQSGWYAQAKHKTTYENLSQVVTLSAPVDGNGNGNGNGDGNINIGDIVIDDGTPIDNNNNEAIETDIEQPGRGAGGLVPCDGSKSNPCTFSHLMKLVGGIINYILFYLMMPLAALGIAYAGIKLVTSAGDPAARTKAKEIIKATVTGIVVCLAAWLIVQTILVGLDAQPGYSFLKDVVNNR